MNATDSIRPGRVLRVFWGYIRTHRVLLPLVLFGVTGASLTSVFIPVFLKRFFDVLAAPGGFSEALYATAFGALVWAVSLSVVRQLGWRAASLSVIALSTRVMRRTLADAYAYTARHAYSFFQDSFVGSLVRKINKFSQSFDSLLDQFSFQFVPLAVQTLGILVVVFFRSQTIALALCIWVVVFMYANYATFKWKQKYEIERAELDSAATGALSDSISNNAAVRSFARFSHEESLLGAILERLRLKQVQVWNIDEVVRTIQGALSIGIEAVVLFLSLHFFRQGTLTIGDFVLFQTYIITLTDLIWSFSNVFRSTYRALSDAHEMVEILEKPYDVADVPGARALEVPHGEIVFDHVSFAFNKTRVVLDDFSLTIAPGEKIAFVGPSGAGKSTITKLLLRFFDVASGRIRIDGQDISHVTQDSLRENVALVPQEPALFHRTLMDNIRYGRLEATDNEVFEAAKKARCHEFISELPDGYNTFVGERGVKLSGGERQRVAIARAILKDAPVLVLDEATSSLDSESESLIQDALGELMKGKTTLVVAHRLSTIMKMDRIVVIEKGSVRAIGTHAQLLKKDALYKKLWSIQAGGFIK
ncbi:MAG: ABC transporter ATP-binding protein [Candidatus Campbellbacteria bacterium]